MSNKICNILENTPGWKYHFKIALLLRESYFISTIILGAEVWYNVTEKEIRILERADEKLSRKIMGCSSQVTI